MQIAKHLTIHCALRTAGPTTLQKASLILFFCCVLTAVGTCAFAYPRTEDDLIETSCDGDDPSGRRVLVVYDTIHGSTAEVAEQIGLHLCNSGFGADVRLALHVADIGSYDAVIVGSALYRFSWLPGALRFLDKHSTALAEIPTAFFVVGASMSEDTPETRRAVTEAFIEPVLRQYPEITPLSTGLFGGAVDFAANRYTLFETLVLRLLGRQLGYTDSADWRDWESIRRWSDLVAGMLQP